METRNKWALLALMVLASLITKSQCLSLTCPSNTTVNAPITSCGAVVNYNLPVFTNACATQTFVYTGNVQTYTVPTGVTSITVDAYGAAGANSNDRLTTNSSGGLGGRAFGVLSVTPGQVLYINVGGAGLANGNGGFNGGGAGGSSSAGAQCYGGLAAGGGGASDIRLSTNTLASRLIVAGGGGGSGRDYCNGTCQPCGCGGSGGDGGGLTGSAGISASNCGFGYAAANGNEGQGGTSSAGGAGGISSGAGNNGSAGSLGTGGTGASGSYDVAGGGGGGGYYGGGGGGGAASGSGAGGGGGAGGSSFVGSASNTLIVSGVNAGNGKIILSAPSTATNTLTQIAGLPSGSTFSLGTTLQTFSVTDGVNSNTCSFSVTVIDVTTPTITCPGNVTQCVTQVNSIAPVSIIDNCPNPLVTYTLSGATTGTGSTNASGTFNTGLTNVLYRARDLSGNSSTCVFSVNIGVIPTVSVIAASSVICEGQTAQLLGSGATSYTWNTSATTNSIAVTPSVQTSYTVTGSNGVCTNTAGVLINVNPNPIITVNNGTICVGQNFTINPGGASSYTIQGGNSVVSPNATTSYSVRGTSALGCVSQVAATSSVTVNPLPVINVNSGAICAGQNFTMLPSGASTYTIQGGNAVVSPAANASYTIIGTSNLGCVSANSATSSVTVNANPTISVNNGTICAGQSFVMVPSGASTYTFQGGNATVSPNTNASYTVIGTSAAGCVSQGFATSNLTVNPNPVINVNNGSICVGQNFTITPNGASTYTIQGGNAVVSPSSSSSYTVMGTSALGCISQAPATSSVVVNVNPTIAVNSGSICAGQTYTMMPSGAVSYTFQGGNAAVSPSSNTTYTVRGTSAAGCLSANTATSSVTVNANPTITVNNGTICSGQSFSMIASGANTYTFQGGNAVVSPLTNSTYTVIGTNTVTGCLSQSSATSAVTVNQNPTLTVSGINTICVGQSASLAAAGAATYTWSTGSNNSAVVVTPSVNTTYTVSGSTAAGCSSLINPTVAVQPSITVSIAGPNAVCNGQSANLNASGATTYTWNTAATSATIVPTLSTTTTYTVVGLTGVCANFAVKTITVTPNPTVSITGTTAICAGGSASLTANGATTYSWSTVSTNTSVVVSPSATTVYSVVGSFSTGCLNSTTQTITVYALPVVSISGPSVVCLGGSVSLTANGANTYVWDNAATTVSVVLTPSATSSYSAVGTDTNGCVANASATVTVNPLPVMNLVGTATAICLGDSLSFTASGADTYSWSSGATTASIMVTPTISSTYSVVGTNTFGCTSFKVDSVKVNALPVLTITGNSGTICVGESIILTVNGASTYSWTGGVSGASISISPSVATSYTAVGTSTDACVSKITTSVEVSECTGITAYTAATGVKVYPNPNNGVFTVELSRVNNAVITITNMLGQVVKTQQAEQVQQINIADLDKGMYFINITENNKSVYRTNVVKQ